MSGIYDLHSHILPGIDDGSKSMGDTIRMLKEEAAQGVGRIAFTPHFYAQKEPVKRYLEARRRIYADVQEAMDREGGPLSGIQLKLAAEVYFFRGMGRSDILRELCLEGTDYVFVEMPFSQWNSEVYQEIYDIITVLKLKVMIVHIERYFPFQRDKTYWKEVFDLPVRPQVNAGAFSDFKEKRAVHKFIKKDYGIVLGSDCHNMYSRRPNLKDGRSYICKKYGSDYLGGIDERSEEIWQGS